MNVVSGGRPLVSVEKLDKMIVRLAKLVQELDTSFDIGLHNRLDQSFYMQRLEELKLLRMQLEAATLNLQQVQGRVCAHYDYVFKAWREALRKIRSENRSGFT